MTKEKLTKKTLSTMKQMLLDEKNRLENDLKKFAHKDDKEPGGYASDFPDYGSKEDENAAEVADYEVRISIENNLEKSLHDINQALDRIKDNNFGFCKYCNQLIEEKRLMVRPHSSACMSCKKAIKQEV